MQQCGGTTAFSNHCSYQLSSLDSLICTCCTASSAVCPYPAFQQNRKLWRIV